MQEFVMNDQALLDALVQDSSGSGGQSICL